MTPLEGTAGRDIPIACELEAFDAGERRRHAELRQAMKRARLEVQELPDGYAFLFPDEPSLFLQIAEWITLERRCCPFFAFSLELPPAGPIRLSLTGGEGVKDFLRAELAASGPAQIP